MPTIALPVPLPRYRWIATALVVLGVSVVLFLISIARPTHKLVMPQKNTGLSANDASPYAKGTYRVAPEVERGGGGGGGGGHVVDLDRKVVRTGTLELEVKSPAQETESIRVLAERLGGYLVSSQISGSQDLPTAAITIRVPAARFEDARAEIKKLAARVETEKTEASDVTRDYVDQDARLRNLRATEAQYLSILKRATTVKDTLAVSEKLNEVRGEIEQQQAEFDTLSKQIETVAINIALRAQADTRVFGLHWRPWYQVKLAARDGLDGLGDYAATMTAIIMYLPAILLWMATILVAAVIAWRLLRWVARVFFAFPKPVAAEKAS